MPRSSAAPSKTAPPRSAPPAPPRAGEPGELVARLLAFPERPPGTPSEAEREVLLGAPVHEVLGRCLDLRGAVVLHDALRSPPRPPAFPAIADRRALARALREAVTARLEAIRARVIATVESRLRTKLPDADEIAATLLETKAYPSRRAPAIAKAATALYGDWRAMLKAGIERIRAEIQQLREDLAEDLRPFGPRAFRLDALDGALRKATAVRAAALLERIPGVLAEPFAAALADEVAALPPPTEAAPLPVAALRALHRRLEDRFLAQGKELLLAFFQVERRPLDALVSEEVLCP